MKVVINRCHGGFGLSDAAEIIYRNKKGIADDTFFWIKDALRNDTILVEIVETMGKEANNRFSKLKVVEITDDVEWEIAEYDGLEWVAEKHRTWE